MLANQSQYHLLPPNIPPAWACAWGEDEYGIWTEFEYKGVVQRMRWISPGVFMMGSLEDEPDRFDDESLHEVEITQGYWLADTACTQALWEAVMGENPSRFKGHDRPVDSVSWEDCQVFFDRINKEIDAFDLCLPTEAQWEYACRAGTNTPFWFGDTIDDEYVNYGGKYKGTPALADGSFLADDSLQADGESGDSGGTAPVKTYPPNPWGLYEMHGNVFEWCFDWYGPYENGRVIDPQGPDKGVNRVLRGGTWGSGAGNCRSACRIDFVPSSRGYSVGFRLSRGQ